MYLSPFFPCTPKGQITAYVYDVRNLLAHVLYNSTDAANSQRDYAYDNNGNLRTVTEPAKTGANVEYHYDPLNRAIDETSSGVTHTYTYDLAGNRLKTVYGGTSREIDSEYDALNRLLQMTENGRTSTYAYDLNGNAVEKTLPNGDTEVAVFDALNRCSSQTTTKTGGGSLYTFGYDYDRGGNVTTVTEDYPSGLQDRTVSNTYDAINRLLVETVTGDAPHSVTTYVYDHANNRTSKAVTGTGAATTNYTYNHLNQLTGYTDGTRHVALTYDLNGNRTTRVITGGGDNGTDSYSYDFEKKGETRKKGTGTIKG